MTATISPTESTAKMASGTNDMRTGPLRSGLCAATAVLLWLLAGCSRHAGSAAETADAGTNGERILNIYSWSDYIAPDTVANFEKETGIKVRYDTYDSNEVLETKLLTGHAAYDIVIPTGTFFEQQRKAGVYRKLDKSALPNLVNLDPDIMHRMAAHDPDNAFAVPYMWTTTGLGFDTAKIHARLGAQLPDGWALLLDPKNAAKIQDCGIGMIDAPMDIFQSVIIYLGHDPNRLDPADVTAASAVLQQIRPFIRYISTDQYMNDLANGGICFALGWSGDIERARIRAKEAANGVTLTYVVPREGGVLTVDMVGIPADAPHPRNALLWMNYLMRPDVMAGITNFINYPNGNLASLALVDPSVKNDTAIYPDAQTRARLVTPTAVPQEYSRLITREWTRFRTGY
jgi:putrescine transport system substrate-binding protein